MGFTSLAYLLIACCGTACCIGNLVSGAEQEYQQLAVDLHNQYRSKHHAGPLTGSDDLNNRAIQCAQYYAGKGAIDHSCPFKNGAGENLWDQYGGTPSDSDAAKSATDGWYSEEPTHDYTKDWQPPSGHFSQLVWKNSTELGFGTGRSGNMIVGCALYSPAGNVMGQFKDNVFPV